MRERGYTRDCKLTGSEHGVMAAVVAAVGRDRETAIPHTERVSIHPTPRRLLSALPLANVSGVREAWGWGRHGSEGERGAPPAPRADPEKSEVSNSSGLELLRSPAPHHQPLGKFRERAYKTFIRDLFPEASCTRHQLVCTMLIIVTASQRCPRHTSTNCISS